jgi:hypothetical protein
VYYPHPFIRRAWVELCLSEIIVIIIGADRRVHLSKDKGVVLNGFTTTTIEYAHLKLESENFMGFPLFLLYIVANDQ